MASPSLREILSNSLTSEERLLFCCSRVAQDDAARHHTRELLRRDLDWKRLIHLADRNKVLPLVQRNLVQAGCDSIPLSSLEYIDSITASMREFNNLNRKHLAEVIGIFKRHDIPVVSFKGAVFTQQIYGDPALRQSGDIDLLVRREDFLHAKEVLIREGFRNHFFGHHEVSAVQSMLVREDIQIPLCVDMHYSLTPHFMDVDINEATRGSRMLPEEWLRVDRKSTGWFFHLDTEPMWGRLGSCIIDGVDVPVFSPEDMFLVAMVHGIKAHWAELKRVCDIAEIVRVHPGLDWSRIIDTLTGLRCTRKAFSCLLLAHHLLGMPLPATLADRIRGSGFINAIAIEVRKQICAPKVDRESVQLYRHMYALLSMDRLRDSLLYLAYMNRKTGTVRPLPARMAGYRDLYRHLSLHTLAAVIRWSGMGANDSTLLGQLED